MKKVIFLDFDGVLNTENYQAKLRSEGKPQWDDFGQVFDPEAVENLKMVLDAVPDTLLVINSSWKLEGHGKMKELWQTRGLPGKIHGVTPDYVPDLLNIDLENYDNIEQTNTAYCSLIGMKRKPVDIVVGNKSLFERRKNINSIEKIVAKEGVLLYER